MAPDDQKATAQASPGSAPADRRDEEEAAPAPSRPRPDPAYLVDGRFSIVDLVDIDRLRDLLEVFSRATGFTTGFVSYPDQEVLIATGWRDICTKFHRAYPESVKHCHESNKELTEKLKNLKETNIKYCGNGLVDAATPVYIRGKHLASLATGQVFLAEPDRERFVQQAETYGYDRDEYLAALSEVPVVSENQLKDVMSLLTGIASLIAEQGLNTLRAIENTKALEREILDRKQAEEGLKESEARYRAIFENAAEGILIADAQTRRIRFANPALCRLLGYRAEDLCRRDVQSIHAPEDLGRIQAGFEALQRGEQTHLLDARCLRQDGTEVVVDISAGPQISIAGRDFSVAFFTDATERIKTLQALRESEEQHRLLVENQTDLIVKFDTEGRLLFVSPSYCRTFQKTQDELIGQAFLPWIHEDDLDRLREASARVYEPPYTSDVEIRAMTRDGWRWQAWVNTAVLDEHEQVVAVIATGRDITERKQAEEKLLFLSHITEQVSDSVIATDLDYRITYTNRSFQNLYGFSPDELLGQSPDVLNAEPDWLEIQGTIYGTVSAGEVWRGEVQNRRKDGSTFPCDLTVFPLVDDQGNTFAYIGIQRDITERKREEEIHLNLERQVQHAQKLESLGVLAGGIAHDFNNLLMVVLGNTDLALRELPATSPAHDYLADIEKASRRAADLCRQMLAYSGKGKFVIEAVDLSEVVRDMAHMLEISLAKKAVLRLDLTREIPPVAADPSQIRQIVMNLITNASEAIGDRSGVISLSSGVRDCDQATLAGAYLAEDLPPGPYVFLEVRDTGCGMDQQTLQRVFDPFFTTKFTGRGLGMAAVMGIVRSHRGAIQIDSEPGRGTNILVLFPVADPATRIEPSPKNQAQVVPGPQAGSGTVLLVEDEEAGRALGRRLLEKAGYQVLTAIDGREAVALFAERHAEIDCVLLDLTMPHMDGGEAFAELRRIQPDVRVILSSGYPEQEVMENFAGQGLAGFIQKPFRLDTLSALMQQTLAR